jgi:hypothetical protein
MSTCGDETAASPSARSSAALSIRSFEWTLATTTSRRASHLVGEVERAVLEDVDLHPREHPERDTVGIEPCVDLGDLVELTLQTVLVEAVGDREPCRVVGHDDMYSWPSSIAAATIESIGAPPSLQVEWR